MMLMTNNPVRSFATLLRRPFFAIFTLALTLCTVVYSAQSHAASPAEQSYRLGAGDEIQIRVFGEDDMQVQTRIGESGTINYPFLGEIKVSGQTATELERTLVNGLKAGYLVDPVVSVTIAAYRPFFVNGEVQKPGAIPFQPGITVRKAIAISGGFTDRARRSSVDVIRATDASGVPVKQGLDDVLHPGDIVTVKASFF
ncbi:Polysaccharide export protein [gamma proteobacterium HdN1]|nr:Polysaccharide export protein [gamma proteobacterium HdN1]